MCAHAGSVAALQIQNRLVNARLDRCQDAPFARRDAENREEFPLACLTAQRIQSLACCHVNGSRVPAVVPPLSQCVSGNSGGQSSHAAAPASPTTDEPHAAPLPLTPSLSARPSFSAPPSLPLSLLSNSLPLSSLSLLPSLSLPPSLTTVSSRARCAASGPAATRATSAPSPSGWAA
jgi:hypothetical protein